MALPLIGLEYTDVEIEIVIRPIKELYTIVNTDRDISGTYVDEQLEETDDTISQLIGNRPYVRTAPDYNNALHQLKWFLYPPSRRLIDIDKKKKLVILQGLKEKPGMQARRLECRCTFNFNICFLI